MSSAKSAKFVLLVLFGCGIALVAHAQTYTVLYTFAGVSDGANPQAGLVFDSAGNLYGTTVQGGAANAGTVFKLDANGNESLLYSFTGTADGGNPSAALAQDLAGDFYGTTQTGGAYQQGTVFKLVPAGNTVLHAFTMRKDGHSPAATLRIDAAGTLYGTTVYGGSANMGTVFRLDASLHEIVLHSFRGSDGSYPYGSLIQDSAGNLYGTTYNGRACWGTVFKMDVAGNQTILHKFKGKDGAQPRAGLIMDSAGILYGTTLYGGTYGMGAVFKVDPVTGKETVLHSFSGADGGDPYGGLVMDSLGNLYGTTYYGGTSGYGTIFKLEPAGHETVIHSFTGGSDGIGPMAGLVRDTAGNLYGTTIYGGSHGSGVVFKMVP